jgi:hypothetical protein
MPHNHHYATKSASADLIEQEIDSALQRLQLLFSELKQRIVQNFHPDKLLQKRWIWLIVISFVVWLKMCHIVKIIKNTQWPCICINHHHWHHFLFFPHKKFRK